MGRAVKQQEPSYTVKPYNEARLFNGKAVEIWYGESGCGKTSALKYKLNQIGKRYRDCIVFSQTAFQNHEYDGIFPNCKIYKDVDENVLEMFVKTVEDYRAGFQPLIDLNIRAKAEKMSGAEYEAEYERITYGHCSLVILDDSGEDTTSLNKKIIKKAAKMGRHSLLGMSILLQGTTDVPKSVRNNAFTVYVLQVGGDEIESVHKYMFKEISYTQFKELYLSHTSNFCILIKDKDQAKKDNVQGIQTYYAWKVPHPNETPVQRVGTDAFWATCQALTSFNQEVKDQEESFIRQYNMEVQRQHNIAVGQVSTINPILLEQWRQSQTNKPEEPQPSYRQEPSAQNEQEQVQVTNEQSYLLGLAPGIYPIDTVAKATVQYCQRAGYQSYTMEDAKKHIRNSIQH